MSAQLAIGVVYQYLWSVVSSLAIFPLPMHASTVYLVPLLRITNAGGNRPCSWEADRADLKTRLAAVHSNLASGVCLGEIHA
jgi:hypothetical protein